MLRLCGISQHAVAGADLRRQFTSSVTSCWHCSKRMYQASSSVAAVSIPFRSVFRNQLPWGALPRPFAAALRDTSYLCYMAVDNSFRGPSLPVPAPSCAGADLELKMAGRSETVGIAEPGAYILPGLPAVRALGAAAAAKADTVTEWILGARVLVRT